MMTPGIKLGGEHSKQWRNTFRNMAIVVFTMLATWGVVITMTVMANCWFTEAGVLKELRLKHPSVDSLVRVERNFFKRSVVTVCLANNMECKFVLNTDILFNYELEVQP